MTIEIKRLESRHLTQFLHLCRELDAEGAGVSFTRLKSIEDTEELLADQRTFLYGAFENDKLLGVFRARQGGPGKEHSCYIAAALTAASRRQGIARKLMNYALKDLKANGIWMIRAWVYSNNHPSICSLLDAGFMWAGTNHCHQWDEKEQDYVDDLLFHKDLRAIEAKAAKG